MGATINFQQSQSSLQLLSNLQATEEEQQLLRSKKKYLPVDAYDPLLDEEDPEELIERHRDHATGITLGLSKWFYSQNINTDFEMRQCEVLRYLKKEELFEIRWLCNGSTKRVSRFNLLFQKEDHASYYRRLQEAESLREQAELIMKYFHLIQKTKFGTAENGSEGTSSYYEISDQQKTRISFMITCFKPYAHFIKDAKFRNPLLFLELPPGDRYIFPDSLTQPRIQITPSLISLIHASFKERSFSLKTLAALFQEVDNSYLWTHKQIIFESRLPYSSELYNTFKTIVPKEKFIPVQERGTLNQMIESEQQQKVKAIIDIPERSQPFRDLLSTMNRKLHQAQHEKLDSLVRVHANMLHLNPMCLFKLRFTNRYTTAALLSQPSKEIDYVGSQETKNVDEAPTSSLLQSLDAAQSLDMFMRANRVLTSEVLREVRNCMFDAQYEVNGMIQRETKRIKELNEQRRRATSCQSQQISEVTISPAFLADMTQFQSLLNTLYERSVRECFENSISTLTATLEQIFGFIEESLASNINDLGIDEKSVLALMTDAILAKRLERQCFQWKVSLTFDKEEGKVKIQPPPKQWLKELLQLIQFNVEEISYVQCFSQEDIGPARKDGRIKIFESDDQYISQSLQKITSILEGPDGNSGIFAVPLALESMVAQYSHILALDLKQFKRDYKVNDYPIEQYESMLQTYKEAKEALGRLLFEPKLNCGIFIIRVESLKKSFTNRLDEITRVLCQCIKKKIETVNALIEAEVEAVLKVINKEPFKDIEEVCEVEKYLKGLPSIQMTKIRGLIADAMGKMSLLERYSCKLEEEEFARTWRSFARPLEIFKSESECRKRMKRDEKDFFQELRTMVEKLQRDVEELKIDFEILQRSDDLRGDYEDAVTKCDNLLDKLERALSIAEVANRREDLFNLRKTDFTEIEHLRLKFQPYNTLWNLAREYFYRSHTWLSGPLGELDREKVPQEVTDACQTLLRLERVEFRERRATAQVAADLRKLYDGFKPYLPLIIALRNPSLKLRHWENLQKLRSPPIYELEPELHSSLSELVDDLGCLDLIEEIADISDCASREKKLEDAIQKMKDEWRYIKFELAEFRDSGTHVLKAAEPVWDLLDDHIMKTMTIAASPYIKFLQSEVSYWKYTLVRVQEVLEEWTKTQRGWLYLWPIFSSDDIQQQMPVIAQSFQAVDKQWRNVMQATFQNPNVLDACLQARLYENLQQCNETIDRIQKGLNDYLHTKRLAFPRFFFLSNDDLLHILSQTKDPLRVQDHLNKCFEGIEKLNFLQSSSENKETANAGFQTAIIKGMYSGMGEYVEFNQEISPFALKEGSMNQYQVRNIEEWLTEVETQMRDSLRQQIKNSALEYQELNRSVWLFNWPSQIILTLDQVLWTQTVEKEGIQKMKQDPWALKKIYLQEEEKLHELVELIKRPQQSAAHKMTLGALIVLDVHAKDVTRELTLKRVSDPSSFDWISQLRYYVVQPADNVTKSISQQLEINVKMVNTTRLYGFEYLGNQTRLVITPLTDRCYRTLMGALQLNLGGAPEGPAGTGKTETTKDLAKAVAKQCIVFNCSDQLNVESMAKFFKGLACCGAWACFDEFNRIELEVLSVIAQQILTIQTALMRRRPHTPFLFDDEQLPMNSSCAVFITMNPGYAGRSELPDNLKALFRPVAMMIPNYSMIAEISLYSYGFQEARELSVKITQSLRLASEQLSTQSHYDYGMRAVKSIIVAAGELKRQFPDEEESRLALRAISDCNLPKFLSDDIPLFEGIINDLFPTTDKTKPSYEQLLSFMKQVMNQRSLAFSQEFEAKTVQLYETLQVRHGLMLVGATMSGKTESLTTLAQALTFQNPSFKVKINTINPKSLTIGQLYGDFDKISHDWSDGVLAAVIKECAFDRSLNKRWIVLDGPVDAVWIENLNTVLDDNKKLCLSSGEIVKFTPQMSMIFEVEDLLEASPATVSRCGMVYLNPDKIGWKIQLQPWLNKLPYIVKQKHGLTELLSQLIEKSIPKVTDFIFGCEQASASSIEEEKRLETLKPVIPVSKNWIFRQFLSLLESLLLNNETRESLAKKEQELRDRLEAKQQFNKLQGGEEVSNIQQKKNASTHASNETMTKFEKSEIVSLFLMAVIWSYGASLYSSGRDFFNQFIQEELIVNIKAMEALFDINHSYLPHADQNVFTHFYHNKKQMWLRWDFDLDSFSLVKQPVKQAQRAEGANNAELNESHENMVSDVQEKPEKAIEFQSILIPTEDTVRYSYLLQSFTQHSFPVLFIGETGTGKTSAVKQFQTGLSAEEWEQGQMVFSATSTSHQVSSYLHSKVEKLKKGVYGPKVAGHRLMIFLDDLNLPAKERYGAQPPLEMLRQVIDNGGMYDKSNEWLRFINLVFVGAMGIPGGSRTLPSKRLLRHFQILHITTFSKDNLYRIFSKILEWGFQSMPQQWQSNISIVTTLTITLYEKAVQTLLPMPSKSHYLFNLRQVSELVQGLIMMTEDTVAKQSKTENNLLQKLWVYESLRVFSDRLINTDDKLLFQEILISTVKECQQDHKHTRSFIPLDSQYLQDPDSLIFCNFLDFNPAEPKYMLAPSDSNDIEKAIDNIIEFYNQMNGKERLSLLLFDYMIKHLARISRILFKPSCGNGLLIGLGGNGRRTLSKLAAFINDCQTFRVEIGKSYSRNDWQDDLKSLFKSLGIDNKKVVFAFSDSDIKADYFIEDISNMLNVGEVPSLFTQEEIDEVTFEMQKTLSKKKLLGAAGSESQLRELFQQRCRKNIHIILYMSPAGSRLRELIRQYPALVNCTSIDWFFSWPEEALSRVAAHYLSLQTTVFPIHQPRLIKQVKPIILQNDYDALNGQQQLHEQQEQQQDEYEQIEIPLTHEEKEQNAHTLALRNSVRQIFVGMHEAVIRVAEDYLHERGKQVYITPTRFTENFDMFQSILLRKTKQIDEERNTYLMGIKKLEEANDIVDGMKAQLEDLKPVLEQKTRDLERIMQSLDRETREVEAVKTIVDQEAQAVYEQKEVAEGIKNECQARLSEAQPLLDEALKALRTLNVKDFVLMKSFNSPPYPIKLALEAACIMLGIQPKYIEGPVSKITKKATKIPDYWEKSKKLLNDYKKFLTSLENYDKDNIPEDRMHKIDEYLQNPKFVPEEIRKASEAAEGICKWVIAICKYDIIAKEIRPKREALALAQDKLNVVLKKLREKEGELQKIIDQKNALEEECKRQNMEKARLIAQRDECQAKLNRAAVLMSSLSLEKERWLKASERLQNEKLTVTGDSILATGYITYLGAFEGAYRERLLRREWRLIIEHAGLPVAPDFSLSTAIGVPQHLQQWQLKGLPQDSVSIENMIVFEESRQKWPFLIDPQGYALKFLKEYLEHDYIVVKINNDKYVRRLEAALFQGANVICECFPESFDPSLNAIVYRDVQNVKGDKYIKFNDNQVEFNDKFHLYLVSQQANPHFTPDVHSKTLVLNFSVTREGLEQQLLSVVCRHESSRDEDEKDRLLRQNIEFQEQKRLIEEQILEQLRNSGADILDDDTLVNSLNESKKITDDIKQKLHSAQMLEERIEENRKNFKPIAQQGAKLYFAVQEMSQLDPMYQFSMRWFRELFAKSFTVNERTKDIKGRVKQLKQDFLKLLYTNVCRSLFEQHKLMFAFNMAIKLHLEDSSGDEKKEQFNKKLKELEMLQQHNLLGQQHQSTALKIHNQVIPEHPGKGQSSHAGPSLQYHQAKPSIGRLSIAKKSIVDKKSDTTSQTGMTSLGGGGALSKNEEERLKIHKEELHYLLTGLVAPDAEVEDRPNPCESFIDNKTWLTVCQIATLDHFEGLPDDIERNATQWKKFIQKSHDPVPEPYNTHLPEFANIILHKVLKPEKTVLMIQRYVQKALGGYFTKPIIQSLEDVYLESKPHVPIILILTPGNDPMESIKKFGEEKQRVPYPVSLGKGQGERATAVINETRQYGGWVVLQNCHLAKSFLPEIEQIIESLQPSNFTQSSKVRVDDNKNSNDKKEAVLKPVHPDFRLWLTSMSTEAFPFSILQDSIKLTSEPPKGFKSTLIRIYNQIDQSKSEKEFYNSNSKPVIWRKLFLALSFFHGIVRERRRYGSLGWNLSYDFNDSDFRISMRQLHHMIDTFDEVPFPALSYLTGECNYGGRVTDDWDRRTLTTLLKDFYNEKCINNSSNTLPPDLNTQGIQNLQLHSQHTSEGAEHKLPNDIGLTNPEIAGRYHFLLQGNSSNMHMPHAREYYIMPQGEFDDYLKYVQSLPDEESPQLVGLHPNANITQAINDSSALLNDILRISTSGVQSSNMNTAGQGGQHGQAMRMALDILQQIREPFKIKEVEKRYPFKYEESMNSVLLQELARYNTLIVEVKSSLNIMIKTLEGKLVMNTDMEKLINSITNNAVPDKWKARSYPSKKPLLSYIKDLVARLKMLDDWIENGQPAVFWISGFFFTQSFLTGVKQNFARKYRHPIDKVSFQFTVMKHEDQITHQPEDGCYASGLFLEGASWNNETGLLQEAENKVLFTEMPPIHFLPILEKEVVIDEIEEEEEHKLQMSPVTFRETSQKLPLLQETASGNARTPFIKSKTQTPLPEKDDLNNRVIEDATFAKMEPAIQEYQCPIYKTSARAGTLSTTGHSTNYILTATLPTAVGQDLWIKRSVAMLTQLDY